MASDGGRLGHVHSGSDEASGPLSTGGDTGGLSSDEESDMEESPASPMVPGGRIPHCPECPPGATIRVRTPVPISAPQEPEVTGARCTYCLHAPVTAAMMCLQCKVPLCEEHLRVRCYSEGHILAPPTSSLQEVTCAQHKKVLTYFCCEDDICVCADCHQTGDHKGHQTETLHEALEKKKRNLRAGLEQLAAKRQETERRRRSVQERWEAERYKVAEEVERVTALFRDIQWQLEDLEKRLCAEIRRQEERITREVSELIRQLEVQRDELSSKMRHIEELCDAADPLTIVRVSKLESEDASKYVDHAEMVWQTVKDTFPPLWGAVHGLASVTAHKRLTDIITEATKLKGLYLEDVADIRLDEKTSAWDLQISPDEKTASWRSAKPLKARRSTRKKNKHTFESSQVLSTRSFSSGRHYWEVETGEEGGVRIGVTYANDVRNGTKFHVGENEKSWCLRIWYRKYSAIYDRKIVQLNRAAISNKIGVFLDYRAGQLSFFEVDNAVRHLHTFTTTFTEPLYAAFWVYHSWVRVTG